MAQTNYSAGAEGLQYQLKKHEPVSDLFAEYASDQSPPATPCGWFSAKFPDQAERYGPPIFEATSSFGTFTQLYTVALNEDFFAAVLGGEQRLGHHVVFYLPEQRFYFLDSRHGHFLATSEEKLKTLLSQHLIRCMQDMSANVDLKSLFDLRQDEHLNPVIKKARSLLAADESFFSVESDNVRIKGPEFHGQLAKLFTREVLAPSPSGVLTVTECFELFNRYCETRGMAPIERKDFKYLMAEFIREEFKLSLRHDLPGKDHKQQRGWKGLCARLEPIAAGHLEG